MYNVVTNGRPEELCQCKTGNNADPFTVAVVN